MAGTPLAEDLGLADHHRIEGGCDGEDMAHRVGTGMSVYRVGNGVRGQSGPFGEQSRDGPRRPLRVGMGALDLDPLPASTGIQARLCRSDLLVEIEALVILERRDGARTE